MEELQAQLRIDQTWDGHPLGDESASVSIHAQATVLRLHVQAPFHDDPRPPAAPGPSDRLWEFEVIEVFLAQWDSGGWRYLEVELSPHGHHLVLRFEGIRRAVDRALPLLYTAHIDQAERRWEGVAVVPGDYLPCAPGDYRGLRAAAFALHGLAGARRYLSSSPMPGGAPDFHQPDRFPPLFDA